MDHQGRQTLDLNRRERETSESLLGEHGASAGFRVRRLPLIQIIKLALADLHDRRRRSESYPQVERLEELISYWEDTLARLKELPGPSVSLQGECPLPPS
jgi:hypothetical protein